MSLQDWYDSLFVRIFPPVQQFAKGVATGAGIPTSLEEARKGAATALGFAFGVPAAHDVVAQGMQQTGEALTHPLETGRALTEAAQRNPAAAAGVLTGMAMPLPFPKGPFNRLGPFSKLESEIRAARETGNAGELARLMAEADKLKFGERALKGAERRMGARVSAERARVHRELEGPTTQELVRSTAQKMQRELRKLGYEPNRGSYTDDFLTDEMLQQRGIDPEKAGLYRQLRDEQIKNLGQPGMPGTLPVAPGTESAGDYAQMVRNFTNSDISTDFLLRHADEIDRAFGGVEQPHSRAMREAAEIRGPEPPVRRPVSLSERLPRPRAGGMSWDTLQELMRSASPREQARLSQLKPGQRFRWRGHHWTFDEDGMIVRLGPLSPEDVTAVREGGRMLRDVTRQGEARVARERARVHEELEGPTGPLGEPIRTREELGGEMLERADIKVPKAPSAAQDLAEQLHHLEDAGDLPPIASGEKVAVMGRRWVKGPSGDWTKLDGKPVSSDYDWVFRRYFDQTTPPIVESEGGGLMEMLMGSMGVDQPSPIRSVNIERAVEEVALAGSLSDAKARTIVAKRIRDRQKAGIATPQEAVWLNVHRMGGFQKGGFRWHQ